MPAPARQRAAEASRAEPLTLPIVPFSPKDCTLLVQPTEAEIAAHAAHSKAYPSPYEFWLHATAADFQEAMSTYATAGHAPPRGTPRVAAPSGAYKRWLKAATDARHVAVVSAQFMDCWNAALRLQDVRT
jgi:hypothetical protein